MFQDPNQADWQKGYQSGCNKGVLHLKNLMVVQSLLLI